MTFTNLPLEQQAIQARCVHPTGSFVEFEREEINQSIVDRFEQQVATHPERLAVKTKGEEFTYDALNKMANRVARAILERLNPKEKTVALLFLPGAHIVAALLGILKTGKIYVALDPAFPQARTAYMLEDCAARLILTDAKHLSLAQEVAQRGQGVLLIENVDSSTAADNLDLAVSAEAPALILYTSGSTGTPKGVLHNHRNVLVEARNYTNDAHICSDDRLALWHSCSFANSIRNLYGALLNGAALFPYDLHGAGFAALAGWIRTHQITIIHTLATTFRAFLETVAAEATFPSLRVLRLGGEPIHGNDVKRFQRHFSRHCVLLHAMGPTETFTIRRHFITHDWHSDDGKVPVGHAVPDKQVLLLDESGCEVATGEVGEIAVKSKYLAIGYWQRLRTYADYLSLRSQRRR